MLLIKESKQLNSFLLNSRHQLVAVLYISEKSFDQLAIKLTKLLRLLELKYNLYLFPTFSFTHIFKKLICQCLSILTLTNSVFGHTRYLSHHISLLELEGSHHVCGGCENPVCVSFLELAIPRVHPLLGLKIKYTCLCQLVYKVFLFI